MSVVIPTLNEAAYIESTLARLQTQSPPVETLVVDGHSTDETRNRAREAGADVLTAPRGRATQLNRGAEAAEGEILFFLHADTLVPPKILTVIRRTLSTAECTAGTFRLQFDRSTPLLQFYAWCTQWPWIRLCFGDRGLFVERRIFEQVGGYPDWPLFEDLELAARLDEQGGFSFLDTAVTTSARRFRQNGQLRQQLHNAYLWLHYMLGTDPERIEHLYQYDAS